MTRFHGIFLPATSYSSKGLVNVVVMVSDSEITIHKLMQ
jgi:hypothetical protein